MLYIRFKNKFYFRWKKWQTKTLKCILLFSLRKGQSHHQLSRRNPFWITNTRNFKTKWLHQSKTQNGLNRCRATWKVSKKCQATQKTTWRPVKRRVVSPTKTYSTITPSMKTNCSKEWAILQIVSNSPSNLWVLSIYKCYKNYLPLSTKWALKWTIASKQLL